MKSVARGFFFVSSFVFLWGLLGTASVQAALPFAYAARTRNYSAWTPAVRGDTNTTGLAGATVALPFSIAAAEANPAGYAMETASLSAQLNGIRIEDKRIQLSGEKINTSQAGLGLNPDSWGFALSYYSPITESGDYVSPATGDALHTEVSLQEFRFTVARGLFENALSLGVTYELAKALRQLGTFDDSATASSYRLGALYRFPKRIILGLSYNPRIGVGPSRSESAQSELPGFNRSLWMPEMINVGLGWIPNRFFKVGLSLSRVGATPDTALLADQSIATGQHFTLVPRLGESYVVAEYRNFKIEWALGAYYEVSRLAGQTNRTHYTSGLDVNPYFVNLSAGFDMAPGYRNIEFSIGADIVRAARFLQIIPPDPVTPADKFWPSPNRPLPDGLPDGLTRCEYVATQPPRVTDVERIIEDIPKRVSDLFKGENPAQDTSLKEKTPPTPQAR